MFRRFAPSAFVISQFVVVALAGVEPASEPLLDIRIAGLHEVTPHEKDRALHDAVMQTGMSNCCRTGG
jgi:hypothetical protein